MRVISFAGPDGPRLGVDEGPFERGDHPAFFLRAATSLVSRTDQMPFSVPEVLAYLTSAATLEPVGTLVNHVVDEVAARLSGPATANGARRPPSGFA